MVELSDLYALLLHFHVDFMVVNLREIRVSPLTRRVDFIPGMLCICSFGFVPTHIFTPLSLIVVITNIPRPDTPAVLGIIRSLYMPLDTILSIYPPFLCPSNIRLELSDTIPFALSIYPPVFSVVLSQHLVWYVFFCSIRFVDLSIFWFSK